MFLQKYLTIFILILSIFAFTSCESKGPVEKAGEKVDKAVEKTTDKAKECHPPIPLETGNVCRTFIVNHKFPLQSQ